MYLSHPLAVTPGQVIVHRNNMHTLSGKCIEISRQNGNKCFAFTGFHFSNTPLMKDNTADYLHVKRFHSKNTPCRFTGCGKSFGEKIIQRLPFTQTFLKLRRLFAELFIRQPGIFFFQRHNGLGDRSDFFQFTVCIASKDFIQESHSIFFLFCRDKYTVYIIAQSSKQENVHFVNFIDNSPLEV